MDNQRDRVELSQDQFEKKVYEDSYIQWGLETQLVKLTEECSELAVGVCKYLAKDEMKNLANVLEEMADVEIMIEQVKHSLSQEYPILKIKEKVDEVKKAKICMVKIRLEKNHE